jgi:DNA-directed RNA polymerase subunit RPC12/RpoP
MQLYTTCQGCGKHVVLKSKAVTRPELRKKVGEYVEIACSYCSKKEQVNINDNIARPSGVILWSKMIFGLVLAFYLWCTFNIFSLIALGLPFLIWGNQAKKIHTFYDYKIY